VAVDPNDPRHLVAGSNSEGEGALRAYSSLDGGASWASEAVPSPTKGPCFSDPAAAIDLSGRELLVYMRSGQPCDGPEGGHVTLRLASRTRGGGWTVRSGPLVAPD